MTDLFDLDEEDEEGPAQSNYSNRAWRSRIALRIWQRIKLIVVWFRLTILPNFGWRVLGSMIFITVGRLADAASFVLGIFILTHLKIERFAFLDSFEGKLVLAAIAIASVMIFGSVLGYIGHRSAVRLGLDYQSACLADGIAIIRYHKDKGTDLPTAEALGITRQAPRMMARSLLQVINLCTSVVMMATGFVVCVSVFPVLTAIVLLALMVLGPIYIVAAAHGTNIGHNIRLMTPGYRNSIKTIQKKWLDASFFRKEEIIEDLKSDENYQAYQHVFGARLNLSTWNHILSNMTLAFVISLSLGWFAYKVEPNAKSIAALVSYLISLRLFAHGLAGIFSGIQSINTFIPSYLLFLRRDPRFSALID